MPLRLMCLCILGVSVWGCTAPGADGPRRCDGKDLANPTSIEGVVALLNALPRPTSLPCLLESLERPLHLAATSGAVSAQPAQGARSPRLFVFQGPLILSVVPAGPGANLLELGEQLEDGRSVKAEIAFPLEEGPLEAETPYTRVMFDPERTSCSMCHLDEQEWGSVGSATRYVSRALRPIHSQRVSLERVQSEHDTCMASEEPERCALFQAIFGLGDVLSESFPDSLDTLVKE